MFLVGPYSNGTCKMAAANTQFAGCSKQFGILTMQSQCLPLENRIDD